jgi:hypothetical protein
MAALISPTVILNIEDRCLTAGGLDLASGPQGFGVLSTSTVAQGFNISLLGALPAVLGTSANFIKQESKILEAAEARPSFASSGISLPCLMPE